MARVWWWLERASVLLGLAGIGLLQAWPSMMGWLKTVGPYATVVLLGACLFLLFRLLRSNSEVKGRPHVNERCIALMEGARESIEVLGGDLTGMDQNHVCLRRAGRRSLTHRLVGGLLWSTGRARSRVP